MAVIDFPATPSVGQQFAAGNGVTYQWSGVYWYVVSVGYLPLAGGTLTGPLIAPIITIRSTAPAALVLNDTTSGTNKTLRNLTSYFQIINNANSAAILQIADSGDTTLISTLNLTGPEGSQLRFTAASYVWQWRSNATDFYAFNETASLFPFSIKSAAPNGALVVGSTNTMAVPLTGTTARFSGPDTANVLLLNGLTRGMRFTFSTVGSVIEGVDNTGVTSFQPLYLGGSSIGFNAPVTGTTATFITNVNGASYPGAFNNSNTGASASGGISIASGGRYAVIEAVYSAQFLHEWASGLLTRYTDYDTHYFRSIAGTQLVSIVSNGDMSVTGALNAASLGSNTGVVTSFKSGTNASPYLRAQSASNDAYAPPVLSLWRQGISSNAAPSNATVGMIRMEGYDSANGYAEFGEISASLVGTNLPGGGKTVLAFYMNEGLNAGNPEYFRLDGNGQTAVFAKPLFAPTAISTVNNTQVATTAYVTTAVTAVVGGATGNNANNKLSGSVAITTTSAYVNGPTTGSVGANGQKWMVTACAYFDQPTAGFDFMGAQVWNGSASVQTSTVTCDGGRNVCCTICTIVTLTGATTFTLRGTNFSAARGNLNGDSHITAVRLS